MRGVLEAMNMVKLKVALAMAMVVALGVGGLAYRAIGQAPLPGEPPARPGKRAADLDGLERRVAALEAQVAAMQKELKQVRGAAPRPFRVFRLQHGSAASVAKTLTAILGAGNKAIRIQADERTNALVVEADRKLMDEVGRLLEELDGSRNRKK
jgi:type II secretory pathway component GspD/PulD (secretin)